MCVGVVMNEQGARFTLWVATHEESRVNERPGRQRFQSSTQNGSGPCDFTPPITLSFFHLPTFGLAIVAVLACE